MKTNEFVTIDQRYIVQSHGNGWAYRVTENHQGGRSFFVQDSDALALQEATENFEYTDVLGDYMDLADSNEEN
jgi:hypothetical protein